VEKRGLSEVGVYRVAGVLRDVEELRQAFDTGGNIIHTMPFFSNSRGLVITVYFFSDCLVI
jgi:hypothetical protein